MKSLWGGVDVSSDSFGTPYIYERHPWQNVLGTPRSKATCTISLATSRTLNIHHFLFLDSLYFATNQVLLNSQNINTRRSDLADRASPQAAAAKFAYAKSRFGPQGTMATETRPPHHVRSHMDLRKAPSPNRNTRNLDLDWKSF